MNRDISRIIQNKRLGYYVTSMKKGISSYHREDGDLKVPLINIKDIQEGIVDFRTVDYVSVRRIEVLEGSRVFPGDVIISVRGSNFKAAVVDNTISGFAISSNLVALSLSNRMRPELLAAYLESPAGQRQLQALAGGITIKGLSPKALLEIKVPMLPLEQQEVLSEYLKLTREYNRVVREEIELREKIKDAILMKSWGVNNI